MNMHFHHPSPSPEAVLAPAPDAAPVVSPAADPLGHDVLPHTLHELRDLLAPVVHCAAILRLSSAGSARVERTSEVLARNLRGLQRLLDELDSGRPPGRHLHRS